MTAWAHGVVVLYSTDNYESFMTAEQCISEIKKVTMRDALIVLVANNMNSNNNNNNDNNTTTEYVFILFPSIFVCL